MFQIKRAQFPEDLDSVLSIYREYVSSTNADLSFQNNEKDFFHLSENYGNNTSQIFIAYNGIQILGCAAFRKFNNDICEMKRVYVRPEARGEKIGETLVHKILSEAKSIGYKKMCLDVLPEFKAAYRLYLSLGFTQHEPITFNPIQSTKYLALDLESYNK